MRVLLYHFPYPFELMPVGNTTLESALSEMTADDCRRDALRALQEGDYFASYESATSGEALCGEGDGILRRRLVQLKATALARTGATRHARRLLEPLIKEGSRDADTVGAMARCYRDLALETEDPGERKEHFRKSMEFALIGYEAARNYYNGGQATHAAFLCGEVETGKRLNDETEALVLAEQAEGKGDGFWQATTLGEVCLHRRDWEGARRHFTEMRALGADRPADVGSCARVCRMLMDAFGVDFAEVAASFALDPVVVFSGQLFDEEGRTEPRFPVALEKAVAVAIREALAGYAEPIAYCSLSWGGNILFAEAVLEKPGAALHIVLSAPEDVSCLTGVREPAGLMAETWVLRYETILARAESVKVVAQTERPEVVDYVYANRVMHGLALLKGRQLQREVVGVALWDGGENPEEGETADFLRHFEREGCQLRIISPLHLEPKGVDNDV